MFVSWSIVETKIPFHFPKKKVIYLPTLMVFAKCTLYIQATTGY